MKEIFAMSDRNDSFYVQSYGYEGVSKNAHWGRGCRDIYILHYVLEGEGYFNNCRVEASQGFIITPGILHEYQSSADKPWKYFWVTFGGNDAQVIYTKYTNGDENGIFGYDLRNEFVGLYENIMQNETPMDPIKALGYFFMLMSFNEKKQGYKGNYYVEESKKYMKANLHRGISIMEVAKNIGINDRYLYNLFIKNEGISPKKYLTMLKLDKAKKMLKAIDCSISEIAVSSGFDDVLSFSRFFSRNVGMSPTDYKNGK